MSDSDPRDQAAENGSLPPRRVVFRDGSQEITVKAVLFDLDGTLYDPQPLRARMLAALLWRVARGPVSGMKVLRTLRLFRRMREDLRSLGDSAPSLDDVQYEEPGRVLGYPAEFVRATVRIWMFTKPLPLVGANGWPQLRETLLALRREGLSLGVFSDYPPKEKLEALGVDDLFDTALAATDPAVNAFKPHPAGFIAGAKALGADPREVLYVGDRFEVDGAGAEAAGMPCLILQPGGAESPAAPGGPSIGVVRAFSEIRGALGIG